MRALVPAPRRRSPPPVGRAARAGTGGDCLEVCDAHTTIVPVRDSKVPHGPVLTITAPAWTSFVTSLK
nr:DUF397 domain-containing protein [Streptomyces sp. CB02400]